MEKHCVSLEIAKQLKDAGWNKKTKFWWCLKGELLAGYELRYFNEPKSYIEQFCKDVISSPFATELLDDLPREISINQYPENDSVRYQVGYNKDKMALQTYRYSNNLCDALAEMWIYLKKEKIICQKD